MRLSSLALTIALSGAGAAAAQTSAPVPLDPVIGESGAAYQEAVRWRWVRTEVQYFDPDGPAPDLNVRARIPRQERESGSTGEIDWTSVLILMAILLAIAALIARFGNFSVIGLRALGDEKARGGNRHASDGPQDERIEALEAIRAIPDRAEAIHRLLIGALALAARAAGMRIDPSWTARDALRRIPSSWPYRGDLARLAQEAELVHFGGRPLSEDRFEEHVRAMVPVFREGAAT